MTQYTADAFATKRLAKTLAESWDDMKNSPIEADETDRPDHEISMASSELYNAAKNAIEIYKKIQTFSEVDGLDAWQQSKITKAADYLNSVFVSLDDEEDVAENIKTKPPSWVELGEGMSIDDKISIFESYYASGIILESDDHAVKYFNGLLNYSVDPKKNKKYIVTPLMLIQNRVIPLNTDLLTLTFQEHVGNNLVFTRDDGTAIRFPEDLTGQHGITRTFVFNNAESYNNFRSALLLKFNLKLPSADKSPDQGVAEGLQKINWVKPNFDFEWHEVEEQSKMKQVPVDVRQYYQKHFPNKDAWLKAVQNGKAVVVPPDHAYEIRNAPFDKAALQKVLAPTGHEGPIGPAKEKRVNDLFDKGQVEMPIILKTSQGLWLIGGKTRLGTANYVKGLPAKVWLISGEQGVAEGSASTVQVMIGNLDKQQHLVFKTMTFPSIEAAEAWVAKRPTAHIEKVYDKKPKSGIAEAGFTDILKRQHEAEPQRGKTIEIEFKGWTIKYRDQLKPTDVVPWIVVDRKLAMRHKDTAQTIESAITAAKEWIMKNHGEGSLATKTLTFDFNAAFINHFAPEGETFYATVVSRGGAPYIVISGSPYEGLSRSAIRSGSKFPSISLSPRMANAIKLQVHGRYIIDVSNKEDLDDVDGALYPLVFQDIVQDKTDRVRLKDPALTVAQTR